MSKVDHEKKFLLQLTILTMRATNIKATRGAVATIHSGSDRRKKSKTIESTLDQVPGDFHSKYTARARTLVTKMMFWASTLFQLFYFRLPSLFTLNGLTRSSCVAH
jgi:hypothetical protein